jgi:hypothetical protein
MLHQLPVNLKKRGGQHLDIIGGNFHSLAASDARRYVLFVGRAGRIADADNRYTTTSLPISAAKSQYDRAS